MTLVFAWTAAAWAHGGPPFTDLVVWGPDGLRTLATSHGLLFEDDGWGWVCEEVLGDAARSGLARTSEAWLLGSTHGVLRSTDGCDWSWNEELRGKVVGSLRVDPQDPDVVWVAGLEGLWRSDDHGVSFSLFTTPAEGASVRSAVIAADGTFYVLGFQGSDPTVWVGAGDAWTSAVLPVSGGRLEAIGTDPLGRGYGRFPLGSGADQLLRFGRDGSVEDLLSSELNIAAFKATEQALYVSLRRGGVQVSTDDGESWASAAPDGVECLLEVDGTWFSCPEEGEAIALQTASAPIGPWTTELPFNQIGAPRCAAETTAGAACVEIWDIVVSELGLELPADTEARTDTDEGDPSAQGCTGCVAAGGGGASPAGALLGVLVGVLMRRRRDGIMRELPRPQQKG